jgi:phage gpG-like protein
MTVIVKINLADELHKKMASLIHKNVYVGIPGDAKKRDEGDPVTNAQLGYIHEKGSPANNIPARPFLMPGVEDAGKKVSKILGESAVNIKDNESVDIALNKAGLAASQSVKRRITQSIGIEGLKESTIKTRERRKSRRRSGAMKPLIDTGQMLNSITYVTRDS